MSTHWCELCDKNKGYPLCHIDGSVSKIEVFDNAFSEKARTLVQRCLLLCRYIHVPGKRKSMEFSTCICKQHALQIVDTVGSLKNECKGTCTESYWTPLEIKCLGRVEYFVSPRSLLVRWMYEGVYKELRVEYFLITHSLLVC